ncbi:MAG: DoxX family protein [Anaerolineales bacterium]|nr:DoxX family protein [Anaerolineales bacterium]
MHAVLGKTSRDRILSEIRAVPRDRYPGDRYVESLDGLVLILLGLTRIQTRLTPLAGVGLALIKVGAAVWHLQRGETTNIVLNIINGAIVAFIAYGRWKLVPLRDSSLKEPA